MVKNNKYQIVNQKSLSEKCGVFGIINTNDASHQIYLGLHALQHRGQDASGIITFNSKGQSKIVKKKNNVLSAFTKNDIEILDGKIGIGHVRYPTFGSKNSPNNIQPFMFKDKEGNEFATCHNGNLTNSLTLRKELEKIHNIKFQSDSDSEILGHLLVISKQKTLKEKLQEALDTIVGAYSYLICYKDKLIALRDPAGIRPLVLGKKNNEYIFASETVALDINNFKFVRNVKPGEAVIIDNKGKIESFYFANNRLDAICAMEYIYFARPDSILEGQNVHLVRERLGRQTAIEKKVKADIVIGVPDSSLSAALGYAKEAKIPYEYGLIKNKYIGRSFIAPSQEEREKIVKMKLNVNVEVVKDKNIILVDDSIVRGTTMKGIVKLLRDAGAKKIHIRISAPEIKYSSFYGINIQNKHELALHKYTKEQYLKDLKYVDSLEFLSIEGMEKVIGRSHKNGTLNTSCFNAYYPIDLKDYKDEK